MGATNTDQERETTSATLASGMHFIGAIDDVLSILRKKRQQVSGLTVHVQGSRADQHPKVYTQIEALYQVRGRNIDPHAVARAIELSATRYYPAIAMLGKVAEVRTRNNIEEEQPGTS
jgi:putative redox protein